MSLWTRECLLVTATLSARYTHPPSAFLLFSFSIDCSSNLRRVEQYPMMEYLMLPVNYFTLNWIDLYSLSKPRRKDDAIRIGLKEPNRILVKTKSAFACRDVDVIKWVYWGLINQGRNVGQAKKVLSFVSPPCPTEREGRHFLWLSREVWPRPPKRNNACCSGFNVGLSFFCFVFIVYSSVKFCFREVPEKIWFCF